MLENLKQAVNPYLPSWEYVPDGEPYVFGDRVYVYGSHDFFNGDVYCMGDYVCYSTPVDDLGAWRYEGVIYRKDQEPGNDDLQGNLYAPDVAVGKDGRYYLFYTISNDCTVSVAVCDTPAGKYEFYGHVHYADGTLLGKREGDDPQFDPGVLREGDRTYLYTGFCGFKDPNRHGPMCTVLGPDMLTIVEEPVFIAKSSAYSTEADDYFGHDFFEAPSIRKKGEYYYFIYSSIRFHELCYMMSKNPKEGFEYKGVLVSGGDLHIDTYKPAEKCAYYTANNHGSMVQIKDDWYIFYHRHTNGTNYSRQGCFEKLTPNADGTFKQAEMTSCCGVKPLVSKGEYPTYIACNLFNDIDQTYVAWSGWMDDRFAKITQEGGDGDENYGYIANMRDKCIAGFKYFDFKGVKKMSVKTKGYATGELVVKTAWDGEVLGTFPIGYANVWHYTSADVNIPDGVNALYFEYRGGGHLQFASFVFEN